MPLPIKPKAYSADEIAEMATRGEDVSKFFTNQLTVIRPLGLASIDPTAGMLCQPEKDVLRLNVSCQAAIKT